MNTTIWKLSNTIKNYAWGTIDELPRLFDIPNPENKPLAEIWMGAHPAGVSTAISQDGQSIGLDKLINDNPEQMLNSKTWQQYQGLPYLFKILSAKEPLSIQVHPELSKAKLGFAKENQLGIPLDSPKRNYKDPNHKPELVYALTPFLAMNGFRPIAEIVSLFNTLKLTTISPQTDELAKQQTPEQLQSLFAYLLNLDSLQKQTVLNELAANIKSLDTIPFVVIKEIAQQYPDDIGLLMPLLLNVIELQPGQGMFLKAQTPHAYLKGTALEIMANSDNVLRAGLTPKYIDVNELLDNTEFDCIASDKILTTPIKHDNKIEFPIPVDDFSFEVLTSTEQKQTESTKSAEILLCLEGIITISTATGSFTLKHGESVFIAYSAKQFSYQGVGVLARVYN